MKRVYLSALAGLMAVAAPAIAEAAQAIATANVNLRAGPSTQYPPVLVVPAGNRVNIFGCLSSANWCDVGYSGYRGWISGSYLQTQYSSRRIYVDPDYYGRLGIPTVTFRIDQYWDRNYRGRDFYRDRDRWRRAPPPPPVWHRDGPPPRFSDDRGPDMNRPGPHFDRHRERDDFRARRDQDRRDDPREDFNRRPDRQFDGRPEGRPRGGGPIPVCGPGDVSCIER
ncbi:SH3 domain-containing protein [Allorhizobium terrae]|uniref:SH3 domain-containing protein n=1 Tax=Allorhizobium terrae TaxID=1848972 RepID=A0A4S3ZW19_9HYPH|nr:SH3 domain-containing protein [Allorhizobium terrae]THF50005.1 SH3 domain-containing protein [Allorhizobium terrae]